MTTNDSPRIYNLFPRLIGKINQWGDHIDRIKYMGFNWLYVNPIQYTGFSGSAYSVKEYFRLDPLFAVDEKDKLSWNSLRAIIEQCHHAGIKFMLDLVINHCAIDSELITDHPTWFTEKWGIIEDVTDRVIKFFEPDQEPVIDEFPPSEYHLEKRLANPYAIDPADSRRITIWGDLAEIIYEEPHQKEILAYWKTLIDFLLDVGVDGFRCDAAYMIKPEIWGELIEYTKLKSPDFLFVAETLGCTLAQCEDVSGAGFDYIYNSSKYWDFTQPWAVKQYNEFRELAPSISFPESHDTPRLAAETGGREDIQKFRYLFAAFFSAGISLPLGYEFGFVKKMDVVAMGPADWENKNFDISEFIRGVNLFKKQFSCLMEDGNMVHLPYSDSNILLLRKMSLQKTQQILLIYNKDWYKSHWVILGDIRKYLDLDKSISRVEITGEIFSINKNSFNLELAPNEFMLLFQG